MNFYHIVPALMVGTKLVPLSMLRQVSPDLAERESAKYKGREHIKNICIPYLSCTWIDVIHMFAVSPKLIQERQKLLGNSPLQFFEIESNSLNKSHLCVYCRDDEETNTMIFEPFDLSLPITCPSDEHEKWFREELSMGRRLPLFAGIPHILYKGEIEISYCPIIF